MMIGRNGIKQTSALLKKNWISWKRHLVTSVLEIVLPVLLMSCLVITRHMIIKDYQAPISYKDRVILDKNDITNFTLQHYPFVDQKNLTVGAAMDLEKNLTSMFGLHSPARFSFVPKACV